MLVVVCWLLCVGCCVLVAVCWLLIGVRSSLCVLVGCSLLLLGFVDRCALRVVC